MDANAENIIYVKSTNLNTINNQKLILLTSLKNGLRMITPRGQKHFKIIKSWRTSHKQD